MMKKRGAKMPPQHQLCFVMLMIAMCVQSALPQTVNLEDASPGVGFTGTTLEIAAEQRGNKIGDGCNEATDCDFDGAVCDAGKRCQCLPELPATNHIDKCGKLASFNEPCQFNEQCQMNHNQTECRGDLCACQNAKIHVTKRDGTIQCYAATERGDKKMGDACNDTIDCGFDGAICAAGKRYTCQCLPEFPATNHIDKCGKTASINESCFFNEQCEMSHHQTECRDSHCACRFEMTPVTKKDGSIECSAKKEPPGSTTYADPAMIGVLVGMALMFIILCVVLRLFSKARWRENRTIFNTPNPRLMNVSLLKESKLLHGPERRGSRASVRGPSRHASMASLRAQSPQSAGSRRGSQASSNVSATNNKAQISPSMETTTNSTGIPNHAESVTVEVQEPKK